MNTAALVWLVVAASALAQPIPVGPEFQVNQFPYGQTDSAVALDGSGKFVVVWQGQGYSGEDFDYGGIQGRRYDAAGKPASDQFPVNSYLTSPQDDPVAGVDGEGKFVVVWWSYGSESDEFGSIQAQRYDAAGEPINDQFQVNSYTTGGQDYPALAVAKSGNFVVVWSSYGSAEPDDDGGSIHARRYDAEGEPLDGEVMVNSYTTNAQNYPAVAVDGDGRFVVVWTSYGSAGSDTSSGSVQARRYDEDGAAIGDQFQVNSYTTNRQRAPVVAADAAGNFVVVWNSYGSDTGDSDYSVRAQRYDAEGEPVGGEFQVNSYTTDDQYEATVAMDAAGNFVVAWSSYGSTGSDSDGLSVQAQRYDATGAPVGGEFQVNSYTTYGQSLPAVAVDPTGATGNFVVTWTTYDEYDGVFAQRFATPTTSSSSSTTTSTTLEPTTTTSTTLEPTTTTSTTLETTTTTTSSTSTTSSSSSSTLSTRSTTSTTSSSTSTSTLQCGGQGSDGRPCDDGEPCTAPDLCSAGTCIGQRFCTVNSPLPGPPVPVGQGVVASVTADPGATVEAGLFATLPAVTASGLAGEPLAEEVGEPLSKIKTKRVKRKGSVVIKLKLNARGRALLKAEPDGVLPVVARTIVRSAGREAVKTRLINLIRLRK